MTTAKKKTGLIITKKVAVSIDVDTLRDCLSTSDMQEIITDEQVLEWFANDPDLIEDMIYDRSDCDIDLKVEVV